MASRFHLGRVLNRFRSDRNGNVAIIFAIAVIPLVGAVGAAVDYSRASSARSRLQVLIDSTALMLAKQVDSMDQSQLQAKAQSIFDSMNNLSQIPNVRLTPSYNSTTGKLTVTATSTINTTLAGVLGIDRLDISTMTEVVVGGSLLEIALVLDNTGSMASAGKLDALIAASKMFIREMKKASKKPGDIKVSIVPFDTHVNVGIGYQTASWIDWSLMDSSGGAGRGRGGSRWGSSGWSKKGKDSWDSGWSNKWGDNDDGVRNDWDRSGGSSTWNGCVIDRAQPYDTNDEPPSSNLATRYPAENCALAEIVPLTYDWNLAESALDEMKASGKTNLTIGLVWGWHSLSIGTPLTEATTKSNVMKYLVFLTDCENTQNRWTTQASEIDARTRLVCDNIKADKIKIYTIRIKDGNEALLKGCATKPEMYYDVPAVSQMMVAFSQIAKDISGLRISR